MKMKEEMKYLVWQRKNRHMQYMKKKYIITSLDWSEWMKK